MCVVELTSSVQDDGLHEGRRIPQIRTIVLKSTVVTPITEEERVESDIKLIRVRSVEGQWTCKTIGVLE